MKIRELNTSEIPPAADNPRKDLKLGDAEYGPGRGLIGGASDIEILRRWTEQEVSTLPSGAAASAIIDAAANAQQRWEQWRMIRLGADEAQIAAAAISKIAIGDWHSLTDGAFRRKIEQELIPKVADIILATHQPLREYRREELSKETARKLVSFTDGKRKALRWEFEAFVKALIGFRCRALELALSVLVHGGLEVVSVTNCYCWNGLPPQDLPKARKQSIGCKGKAPTQRKDKLTGRVVGATASKYVEWFWRWRVQGDSKSQVAKNWGCDRRGVQYGIQRAERLLRSCWE
jgi:hypothetical protein